MDNVISYSSGKIFLNLKNLKDLSRYNYLFSIQTMAFQLYFSNKSEETYFGNQGSHLQQPCDLNDRNVKPTAEIALMNILFKNSMNRLQTIYALYVFAYNSQ